MNHFDDFDQQFNKVQRLATAGIVASIIAGFGMVGFVVWVVVKLLTHFGVI